MTGRSDDEKQLVLESTDEATYDSTRIDPMNMEDGSNEKRDAPWYGFCCISPPKKWNINSVEVFVIIVTFMAIFYDMASMQVILPLLPIIITRNETFVPSYKWTHSEGMTDMKSGIILLIEPLVEIIISPFTWVLLYYIGDKVGFVLGCMCSIISLCGFALMKTGFAVGLIAMVIWRILQGVGTSLTVICSLILIATVFPTEQRQRALSVMNTGQLFGSILGIAFGTFLFAKTGIMAVLLILVAIGLIDALLRLIISTSPATEHILYKKHDVPELPSPKKWCNIMIDPWVHLSVVGVLFANLTFGLIWSSQTLFMLVELGANMEQIGVVYLASACIGLVLQPVYWFAQKKLGSWLCYFIGNIILGVSLIITPFCGNIYLLLIPELLRRAVYVLIKSSAENIATIVADSRHDASYEMIFGYLNTSNNLGIVFGAALSLLFLVEKLSFKTLYIIVGMSIVIFSLPTCLLRRIPTKE